MRYTNPRILYFALLFNIGQIKYVKFEYKLGKNLYKRFAVKVKCKRFSATRQLKEFDNKLEELKITNIESYTQPVRQNALCEAHD